MVDENLHDRIEKYLMGQLSTEEAAKLESEMAVDPDLADQVALQRIALMGMQRLADKEMRLNFDQWDEQLEISEEDSTSPPKRTTTRNFWFGTAIALLLLFIAGAFWHFTQIDKIRAGQQQEKKDIAVRDSLIAALQADYQKQAQALDSLMSSSPEGSPIASIQQLRAELEQKDRMLRELEKKQSAGNALYARQLAPAPSTVLGGTRGGNATTDKVESALGSGDYSTAVQLLKALPPQNPQRIQRLPYALFYTGMYQEAIPAFLNLWEWDEENEYMNAQGYLLFCYIAVGDKENARQLRLVIMQNTGHKYYKEAVKAGEVLKRK